MSSHTFRFGPICTAAGEGMKQDPEFLATLSTMDLVATVVLSLNASLKVDFQGSRVTSDGGLVVVRDLDERLRFGELIGPHLAGSRKGKNKQLPLGDLLRQPVCSRIAGYEDVADAQRPSQAPTFRLIGSEKIWEPGAVLTEEASFGSLTRIDREPIAKAEALDSPQRVVLDIVAEGPPGALPKQSLMISVNSSTDPAQAAEQASHFGESC